MTAVANGRPGSLIANGLHGTTQGFEDVVERVKGLPPASSRVMNYNSLQRGFEALVLNMSDVVDVRCVRLHVFLKFRRADDVVVEGRFLVTDVFAGLVGQLKLERDLHLLLFSM